MDGLTAAGVGICLVLALILVIGFVVTRSRRRRRQAEVVTVAELLDMAQERGEGVRLNWSPDDLDADGRALRDEFPTTILPKVEDVSFLP